MTKAEYYPKHVGGKLRDQRGQRGLNTQNQADPYGEAFSRDKNIGFWGSQLTLLRELGVAA